MNFTVTTNHKLGASQILPDYWSLRLGESSSAGGHRAWLFFFLSKPKMICFTSMTEMVCTLLFRPVDCGSSQESFVADRNPLICQCFNVAAHQCLHAVKHSCARLYWSTLGLDRLLVLIFTIFMVVGFGHFFKRICRWNNPIIKCTALSLMQPRSLLSGL